MNDEMIIEGVNIKTGDFIEVRLKPGDPWVGRKFRYGLTFDDAPSLIWCIEPEYPTQDAVGFPGGFLISNVRLPNTLDAIVKRINGP